MKCPPFVLHALYVWGGQARWRAVHFSLFISSSPAKEWCRPHDAPKDCFLKNSTQKQMWNYFKIACLQIQNLSLFLLSTNIFVLVNMCEYVLSFRCMSRCHACDSMNGSASVCHIDINMITFEPHNHIFSLICVMIYLIAWV